MLSWALSGMLIKHRFYDLSVRRDGSRDAASLLAFNIELCRIVSSGNAKGMSY
jgi:hypothetical protein